MGWREPVDLKPSPSVKSRTIPAACSPSTGQASPATMTSTRFLWREAWQTWLRQVSPARTCHSRAKVPDLPAPVLVSGGRYAEPFAWYDHGSRCWRTWQLCLIEEWERYSGAWPRSGMTRNGIAYSLPDLAPRMSATDAGSLLPTPTQTANLLSTSMQKWPRHRRLATLTKRDARTLKGGQDRPNRTGGPSLLQQMLDSGHVTGRLNPRWCEWFMGFPDAWTKLIQPQSQLSEIRHLRSRSKSSAAQSCKPKE